MSLGFENQVTKLRFRHIATTMMNEIMFELKFNNIVCCKIKSLFIF